MATNSQTNYASVFYVEECKERKKNSNVTHQEDDETSWSMKLCATSNIAWDVELQFENNSHVRGPRAHNAEWRVVIQGI